MRRRQFITLVGGTAVAITGSPLAAHAQPQEARRVGFVIGLDDAEAQARFASFRQGLERRGWIDARNLEIVARFGAADPDRNQRYVAELVSLHPAVIVTPNTSTVIALMKEAPMIPVVIAQMGDPVMLGFAGSVAHPDRNITGFTDFEPAMATKGLDLLREVVPSVKRLVILTEPESSDFYTRALKPAASSLGVELTELRVNTGGDAELERTIAAFAATPNGGMIITPGAVIAARRALIRDLAARYRLPAIGFVTSGERPRMCDGVCPGCRGWMGTHIRLKLRARVGNPLNEGIAYRDFDGRVNRDGGFCRYPPWQHGHAR
jgi:putative ABC transport system substrate-binding protein